MVTLFVANIVLYQLNEKWCQNALFAAWQSVVQCVYIHLKEKMVAVFNFLIMAQDIDIRMAWKIIRYSSKAFPAVEAITIAFLTDFHSIERGWSYLELT